MQQPWQCNAILIYFKIPKGECSECCTAFLIDVNGVYTLDSRGHIPDCSLLSLVAAAFPSGSLGEEGQILKGWGLGVLPLHIFSPGNHSCSYCLYNWHGHRFASQSRPLVTKKTLLPFSSFLQSRTPFPFRSMNVCPHSL